MDSPVRNRHSSHNNNGYNSVSNNHHNVTTTTSARSTPAANNTTFVAGGENGEEPPRTPHTARVDAVERGSLSDEQTLAETREQEYHKFTSRIRGLHLERVPTFLESIAATARSSQMNLFLPLVIFSWMSQFAHLNMRATFVLSFLALIPLEKLLQFAAKQSVLYLGAHLTSQRLHESTTQMNQTMMTMGVMCLVLPAAFFAGVKHVGAQSVGDIITPYNRDIILQISRGMSIIMLFAYIASRIYALNPPGDEIKGDVYVATGGDEAFEHEAERIKKEIPKISPGFCLLLLFIVVGCVAVTAEGLVHSIDFVKENSIIQEEWFGLVLIPLVSFSGDGLVSFTSLFRRAIFREPKALHKLADAQPIDLSIQFTLFWTPVLVLISWGIGKPLPLLFDLFEVAILVAACFIVNYITADGKTNWAEGITMICLYAIIALVAWYYPGQEYMEFFYPCIGRVHEGGIAVKSGGGGHH
ncbi:hypothetical protein FRC20_000743 [Serendipita sp. 405]|nr:hypothetical protein FRC20_000743 [Serendipita sp. 405]